MYIYKYLYNKTPIYKYNDISIHDSIKNIDTHVYKTLIVWVGCQGGAHAHQGNENPAPYGPLASSSLFALLQPPADSLSPSPSCVPQFSGKALSEKSSFRGMVDSTPQ